MMSLESEGSSCFRVLVHFERRNSDSIKVPLLAAMVLFACEVVAARLFRARVNQYRAD